jgi:hypothetical protein
VNTIPPLPEGKLIRELREQAPRMSVHEAARRTRHMFGGSGISESRWRQIEHGVRWFRGTPHPEKGPAATVARMVLVVGGTPDELGGRGQRPDAAAELYALLAGLSAPELTGRQKRALEQTMLRDASDE